MHGPLASYGMGVYGGLPSLNHGFYHGRRAFSTGASYAAKGPWPRKTGLVDKTRKIHIVNARR